MRFFLLPLAAALAAPALAADAFRLFEDERRVQTAARRVQAAGEAPAAVDVITGAEIAASGARDLCDVLRFRPGLDVVDGRNTRGSNRCVVSIRGFARDAVTEVLVLIDGRSTYSPMAGTILWQQLPVQLQDIERVEIVRGPNAALYGSGAGLGVINVITKAPKGGASATVAASGGSLGMNRTEAAVEDEHRGARLRFSHSHRHQDGYPTVSGAPSNDFLHSEKAAARALWRLGPSTELDVSSGGSWDTLGNPVDANQGRFQSHFQRALLAKRFDEDNAVQVLIARDEQSTTHDPDPEVGVARSRYWQYDAEALHSFGWAEGALHTTWGASYRHSVADSSWLFGGRAPVRANRILRAYAHQTVRLADWARVVGGFSFEKPWSVGTQHVDHQAALVLGPPRAHALRLSYARAHTNPGLVNRYADFLTTGGFVHVQGNRDIESYALENYEAGYQGFWLGERLTTKVSLFYMRIDGHTNIETLGGFPVVVSYFNSNEIIARGAEASARLNLRAVSLFANYTHEHVTDRDAHQLYTKTTPRHKANLGATARLGAWTAHASAGWKDGYLADSIQNTNFADIPAFWRLDARLAWAPTGWLELWAAGHNLLGPRRQEFVDGLLVPRVLQGGAKVRF